jgi:predicted ester cyclase
LLSFLKSFGILFKRKIKKIIQGKIDIYGKYTKYYVEKKQSVKDIKIDCVNSSFDSKHWIKYEYDLIEIFLQILFSSYEIEQIIQEIQNVSSRKCLKYSTQLSSSN